MKAILVLFSALLLSFENPSGPCDNVPELNRQMIAYIKTTINKKVARGECWDLAAQGLNKIGASWDKNYGFGKVVDPKKECVFPGDVIQFENVEIEYENKGTFYKESMTHHTALVYEVKGRETFVIAQQNTGMHGKKVSLDPLELKNVRKGKYTFFRPVK